jgi:hypothetical protein
MIALPATCHLPCAPQPPFWWHRVESLDAADVAVSVCNWDAEEAARFDHAVGLGLPADILSTETAERKRALSTRRFLRLVIRATLGVEPDRYMRDELLPARFGDDAVERPLRCHDAHSAFASSPADAAFEAEEPSPEELALVSRLARALAPPGAAAEDGVVHLVLQDFVENLASFVVGQERMCAFLHSFSCR